MTACCGRTEAEHYPVRQTSKLEGTVPNTGFINFKFGGSPNHPQVLEFLRMTQKSQKAIILMVTV